MKVTLNGREIEFDEDIFTYVTGVMISYAEFPQGELSEDFYSYSQNLFNITADIMRGNDAGFNITAPDLAGFPEFLSREVNGKSVCRFIYEDIGVGTRAQIDKFFSDLNNIFGFNIDPAALGVEPLPAEQPQAQAEVPVEQPVVPEVQPVPQAEQPVEPVVPPVVPAENVQGNRRYTVPADIAFLDDISLGIMEAIASGGLDRNEAPWNSVNEFGDICTDIHSNPGDDKKVQKGFNDIAGLRGIFSEKLQDGRTVFDHLMETLEKLGYEGYKDAIKTGLEKIDGILATGVIAEAEAPKEQKLPEQPKPAVQPKAEPQLQPPVQQPVARDRREFSRERVRLHMENHYFNLDRTEDMAHFIAVGAAEAKIFGADEKNVFSQTEKETFKAISNYFFRPANIVNRKKVLDYASFNERIDALADEVRKLNTGVGRFIKNTDFSKLLGKEVSMEDKHYVTSCLCQEALRSKAIRDYIDTAIETGEIGRDYMHQYLKAAGINDIEEKSKNLAGVFKFALEKMMTPQGRNVPGVKEYHDYLNAEQEHFVNADYDISDEQRKKVKESLSKNMRTEKIWHKSYFSVEGLQGLSNIYDQFNKTKKMAGSDSREYTNLLEALKAADRKGREIIALYGDNDITPGNMYMDNLPEEEKNELMKIYDDVAKKAMTYLSDKRLKRGTESGEERYDIAFSALAITAEGQAKRLARDHNYFREAQKVKKVSIDDLMERSKFDYEGYKSEKKKKGKIKEPRVIVPKI